MKKLITNTGIVAATSVALLSTFGVEKAEALFIESAETFSVSEDVDFPGFNNAPNDRQFKSYNEGGVPDLFGNSNIVNLKAAFGDDVAENSAIVGSYEAEEVRGIVEFDVRAYQETIDAFNAEVDQKVLDGIIPSVAAGEAEKAFFKAELIASAALNFSVFKQGGLDQAPLPLGATPAPGPLPGTVEVSFYGGDLSIIDENLYDYGNGVSQHGQLDDLNGDNNNSGDAIIGTAATALSNFDTAGLLPGDQISLDISAAVTEALDQGWDALAFRLQARPSTSLTNPLGICPSQGCSAITFNKFAIGAQEVPTPAAILPTLFGLGAAAFRKKEKEDASSAT
jgi:hypothetical protein